MTSTTSGWLDGSLNDDADAQIERRLVELLEELAITKDQLALARATAAVPDGSASPAAELLERVTAVTERWVASESREELESVMRQLTRCEELLRAVSAQCADMTIKVEGLTHTCEDIQNRLSPAAMRINVAAGVRHAVARGVNPRRWAERAVGRSRGSASVT